MRRDEAEYAFWDGESGWELQREVELADTRLGEQCSTN
jgi:hypothetical protein